MKKNKLENYKITPIEQNFSQWYLDIIKVADLAEYGPVKGTMIIKPYGYAIWEIIKNILDEKIKKTGVENAYFPLFIPESLLKKESEHVEGFSPEVAVVTYAGGKRLNEAIVVRPTSETIIYNTFADWISSYRDLPILINQWNNVVRWEMRPRLFLRTTEFLWQEGHTAHASSKEADNRARQMLLIYKDFAENYMAIPTISGKKSESEKFAGALYTYTIEAMMQDGKALQLATSHNLGQNFAKAFNISFSNKNNASDYVWQTSWGLSTRTIGALIMVHGDNKGMVLPPKIAPIQIVIVPIWNNEKDRNTITNKIEWLIKELKLNNIVGVKVDDRDLHTGEKYYFWEKRGVPIRIEIGPRDLARKLVVLVRRDNGEKELVSFKNIIYKITNTLQAIQKNLYQKALKFSNNRIKNVNTWVDFVRKINDKNFVIAYWDGSVETERKIKDKTQATIRCIPFDQKNEEGKCIYSGKRSTKKALFARAY